MLFFFSFFIFLTTAPRIYAIKTIQQQQQQTNKYCINNYNNNPQPSSPQPKLKKKIYQTQQQQQKKTVLSGSGGVGGGGGGGVGNTTGNPLLQMPPDSAYYLSNRIPYSTSNIPAICHMRLLTRDELIICPSPISSSIDNSGIAEDQTRKREIRLQKNREAARECRRKKKEYIKCLENRVAVLENQNKALIEELKSLKELYCQTKND